MSGPAMTEERKLLQPEMEAGLEDRGLEAVRVLLVTSAPGAGAIVQGLEARGGNNKWISRADAEFWVRRKDGERASALEQKQASAERRDTIRFWLTLALTGLGAVAAMVAAWEGWLTLIR
jgi:hypothetical protein